MVAHPCLYDLQVGWGVWLVYCGSGVGSCDHSLPLSANLLLLALEELLQACPPGRVGCSGLTEGAGPFAAAILGGDVGTTVLGDGCGFFILMVGKCNVLGWWKLGVL